MQLLVAVGLQVSFAVPDGTMTMLTVVDDMSIQRRDTDAPNSSPTSPSHTESHLEQGESSLNEDSPGPSRHPFRTHRHSRLPQASGRTKQSAPEDGSQYSLGEEDGDDEDEDEDENADADADGDFLLNGEESMHTDHPGKSPS